MDVTIDIGARDLSGQTALITAAARGRIDHMEEFLLKDRRININEVDNSGQTALFWACIQGNFPITKVALLIYEQVA